MSRLYVIFVVILAMISPAARAQIGPQLKNNSAVKKFLDGDLAGGETAINRALEGDASNTIILYNWASANLLSVLGEMAAQKKDKLSDEQKKRIESAQAEFAKILSSGAPAAKKIRKEVLFQNALSLDLLEKSTDALTNYYSSLAETDSELDEAYVKKLNEKTQTNIAHLLVKSDSSSSGKGSGGGGGGESGEDESSGQDPGENEGQKGQPRDQKGQGQKGREPEFSGTDVTETQAQQILNSVSNQDRQVQQRKGQQQSKQNMQNGEAGQMDPRDVDKPW